MKDVFAGLRLLSADDGRPLNALPFDATESEAIVGELRGSVPANALSAHLGCDRTTAAAILNAGLVERVLGDRIIFDRDADVLKRVSLASVHDLLALLFESATTLAVVPVQFATLSAAARHAHRQVDRIIRLALSGSLDLYGLVGRSDFDAAAPHPGGATDEGRNVEGRRGRTWTSRCKPSRTSCAFPTRAARRSSGALCRSSAR